MSDLSKLAISPHRLESEVFLASVAKNDHKKGSNDFCYSWVPAKIINK
jgi:hypothetical protein